MNPQSTQPISPLQTATPVQPVAQTPQPTQPTKPHQKSMIPLVLIILLILAITGAAAYYFLGMQPTQQTVTTDPAPTQQANAPITAPSPSLTPTDEKELEDIIIGSAEAELQSVKTEASGL